MCAADGAVYLYCFARPGIQSQLGGTGIDACKPVVIEHFASVSAVVSEAALEEFCGQQAEKNLKDLVWLSPRACQHEKVIEQAMQDSPVLPARFGTIFSSLAQLHDYAQQHGLAIAQFLDRVAGHEEWAVKGLMQPGCVVRSVFMDAQQAHQDELASLPPGRRYLQEQKMRAEAEKALRSGLKETCRGIENSLRRVAAGFARRRVVDKSEMGEDVEVILNWAFLVAGCNLPAFREEVNIANCDHAANGLALRLTGPWPPYSFAPALSTDAIV
jgi:hypothetical protein